MKVLFLPEVVKPYSSFKRNKHTVWSVFYSVHDVDGETVYLVRHLTNNHVVAHHLDLD